ncbi:MAG TPA: VanZ family protein [Oscillatoriales cyanobacterium M59_W2019_021]|nr:VanZ family protein [Oscillatoriales cyanobacterium M4454_W2019_049]HIK52860.1 VanZ family protein [Oscillatoriales cyanobacterium M59_W2019_021]
MTLNPLKSPNQVKRDEWAKNIFVFGIVAVLFLTLLPFDFEKPQGSYLQEIVTSFGHHSDRTDLFSNLLLFIPFGFGLAGILEKRKIGFGKAAIAITISSLFLSATVEILQVFLPERASTSIDIISNTISGFLGFLIFYFFKDLFFELTFWLLRVGKRWLNVKWAIAIFITYLIFICFLLFSVRDITKLSNWDASYPLLFGNELTADRPWKGQVSQFCIADRAASKTEVSQLLESSNCDSISNFLLADYDLNGNQKSYSDRTQNLPDLVSQGTLPKKSGDTPVESLRDRGVILNNKHWLQTIESVEKLTKNISKTSQLTLVTTMASANPNQEGPARIISLSKNPFARNFTLGQEGNDLSFRLRTPLTQENGADPESIVPNVFADTQFHRVAITYDGWILKIYIGRAATPKEYRVGNVYKLQLSPEAALFWSVMGIFDKKIHLNPPSMWVYQSLYSAIIFVPLGLLFAIVWVSYRGNLIFSGLVILGGIILPAFLVEGVIASCMERSLQMGSIALGIAIETITILGARNWFSAWLRSD